MEEAFVVFTCSGDEVKADAAGLKTLQEMALVSTAIVVTLSNKAELAVGDSIDSVVTLRQLEMKGDSVLEIDFSSAWIALSAGGDSVPGIVRLLVLTLRLASKLVVDSAPADKDDIGCLERWLGIFAFLLPLITYVGDDVKQLRSLLGPMPALLCPLTSGVGMAKLGKKLNEYFNTDVPARSAEAGRANQVRPVNPSIHPRRVLGREL